MFDIGFWELVVIAVIGLIVLGPERLPVVARTLGKWVARARRYASELTSELENEMSAADIRRDVREARERIEAETRDITEGVERGVDSLNQPLEDEAHDDEARDELTAEEAAAAGADHAEVAETRQAAGDKHSASATGEEMRK